MRERSSITPPFVGSIVPVAVRFSRQILRRDRVPSIFVWQVNGARRWRYYQGAQRFRGQDQLGSGNIFREVRAGGGAGGSSRNIWRSLEQPGEGDLHRRRLKRSRDLVQLLRLQRRKTAQREKGHRAMCWAASASTSASSARWATL